MALLQTFKRIYRNDFKAEYQELVDQLSYYINTNFDAVYQALNKNINIKDNLASQLVTLVVKVDATGKPLTSLTFQSTLNQSTILGTEVINAVSSSPSTIFPTSGIFCSFTQSGQSITINNITGLPPNVQFTLTLVTYI